MIGGSHYPHSIKSHTVDDGVVLWQEVYYQERYHYGSLTRVVVGCDRVVDGSDSVDLVASETHLIENWNEEHAY
jgi:hypothetical protein